MSAQKAYGATFGIGDGVLSTTPTYTDIANVKSIGDWELEAETTDVTHHSSTGGWREFIATGIMATSEVELTLSYDDTEATHANASGGLMHALMNRTALAYEIAFADDGLTIWTFDAYVSKIGTITDTGEEELQQTVTLRPTGQPVLA